MTPPSRGKNVLGLKTQDGVNQLSDEVEHSPPVSPLYESDRLPPSKSKAEPGSPAAVPDGGSGTAPLHRFFRSPDNPRDEDEFDITAPDDELKAMGDSVSGYGVLVTITVIERSAWLAQHPKHEKLIPEDVWWVVHLGNTRHWLAEQNGLEELAFTRNDSLADPVKAIESRLIENRRRRTLHPVREALEFQSLKKMGVSQAEIARRTGYSTATITQRLKLLKLIKPLQRLVRTPELSEEAAYPLSDLSDADQRKVLELGPPYTVEHLAAQNKQPAPKPEPKPAPEGLVIRKPVKIAKNSTPEEAVAELAAKIEPDVLKEIARLLTDSLTTETD